jgi:hypothetical protein
MCYDREEALLLFNSMHTEKFLLSSTLFLLLHLITALFPVEICRLRLCIIEIYLWAIGRTAEALKTD